MGVGLSKRIVDLQPRRWSKVSVVAQPASTIDRGDQIVGEVGIAAAIGVKRVSPPGRWRDAECRVVRMTNDLDERDATSVVVPTCRLARKRPREFGEHDDVDEELVRRRSRRTKRARSRLLARRPREQAQQGHCVEADHSAAPPIRALASVAWPPSSHSSIVLSRSTPRLAICGSALASANVDDAASLARLDDRRLPSAGAKRSRSPRRSNSEPCAATRQVDLALRCVTVDSPNSTASLASPVVIDDAVIVRLQRIRQ